MSGQAGAMACPVCHVPLVMSERQGIEIDYCPTCRGVWLDRGELDKIIERSGSTAAPASAPPQSRGPYGGYEPQHRGDHYPRKRKKSFLEELFD